MNICYKHSISNDGYYYIKKRGNAFPCLSCAEKHRSHIGTWGDCLCTLGLFVSLFRHGGRLVTETVSPSVNHGIVRDNGIVCIIHDFSSPGNWTSLGKY